MKKEINYYDYTIKTTALLVSSSSFAKDLLDLIRKYDSNFPENVSRLEFTAEVGKISEWYVTAFDIIEGE